MNRAANNPEGQDRLAAFHQGLQELGWKVGRNVRIDTRWTEDNADQSAKYAAELVALTPDIILASGTLAVTALQRISGTLPIVFAAVADPVGAGIVDSLAHPGGNATGFMIYEYNLAAKYLELLKEIAPSVTRVAIIRNAANPGGSLCLAPSRTQRGRSALRRAQSTFVTPAKSNAVSRPLPARRMAG
jgi:putative ABC transport system substrate-binding protein